MDFISKLLQRKPPKQGGCGSSNSLASTPVTGSEHKTTLTAPTAECETPVQFTREFVEELIENVQKPSDKTTSSTPCPKVEDNQPLSSVGQESLPGSLPDLLLPEAAFKKQSDTDTDTTEYESAAETDPPDGLSRSGSLTNDDVVLPDEAVHESVSTPVSQLDEAVKDNKLVAGDISILCDGLSNLNLDTPERDTTLTYEEQLKTVCDTDHLLLGETFSETLVNISSENGVPHSNLEASAYVNEFQGPCVSVKEVPDVRNQKQNLNAEHDVCINGLDFTIVSGKIPEQVGTLVNTTTDYFKREQSSAAIKPTCDIPFQIEETSVFKPITDVPVQSEQTSAYLKPTCDIVVQSEQTSAALKPISDIPIQSEQISDFLKPTNDIPVQSEQTSAALKPTSHIPVQSEHIEVDITTCVEETSTPVFKQSEDRSKNQDISHTVQSDLKLTYSLKGGDELLEEPANVGALSVNKIESGLCPSEHSSTPQQLNDDALTYGTSLLNSNVTKNSSSDFVINNKCVVESPLILCQKDTLFSPESSYSDAKENDKIVSKVIGAGDSQVTENVKVISKDSDYLEKICVPSLQGAGDTKQKDKDYKLYETIIEISRLQEKDLEKEYGVGSTVKADSTETEEADIGNTFCCTQVLNDFVSENQEFGNISFEADKVAEEIFNVSQEISEELNDLTVTSLKYDIDSHIALNMEDKIDPFLPKSALRHSPPPAQSSNSPKSRGSSPAKRYVSEKGSPKIRPKSVMGAPGKEKNFHNSDTISSVSRAAEPTLNAAKSNETLINLVQQKHSVESMEDSLRAVSLSNDVNHTDTIVTNDSEGAGEVFRKFSDEDFQLSHTLSEREEVLRRESLVAKFDPLSTTACKMEDSSSSLSPKTVKNTNERRDVRHVTPDYKNSGAELPIPNQALAYIDKLISLSPTSSKPQKSTEVLKEQSHLQINDSILSNSEKEYLRDLNNSHNNIPWNNNSGAQEKEAMLNELQELRDMVIKQEQSYTEKVKSLENKIESLEMKLKEKEERECKLNKKITEMTEGQEQISLIMEEYERTIARLVFEKEQEKQEFEQEKANLMKEKDTVSEHLANIEIAFSDVHRKYERSKDVIQGIKSNEEALRASLAEYEATIKQQEQKYDLLKSYATSQLESANQELESLRRSHQAESAKLNAMLKKAEVKASSLEEMVEQKIKENQELASICDELIGKVGSSE